MVGGDDGPFAGSLILGYVREVDETQGNCLGSGYRVLLIPIYVIPSRRLEQS